MDDASQRFVALDLHAAYVMLGALNTQRRVVLPPRRVRLDQFAVWATRHRRPTDNAWHIHDLI